MGLLEKAYETYANFKEEAGIYKEGMIPLLPLSHILQNIGWEVSIYISGNLKSIDLVAEHDASTIIPATLESANRTNNIAPHPLCDNLEYLTDYNKKKHTKYIDLLSKWCGSRFSNNKIIAILKYLQKNTIRSDFEYYYAKFLNKKIKDNELKSIYIRWRVIGDDDSKSDCCWRDRSLFNSWHSYYINFLKNNISSNNILINLDMISGKYQISPKLQPRGILRSPNGAKLISSNDSKNFTYLGRFIKDNQAFSIGYESSQYAHNALIWLIRNQGVTQKGMTRNFVCWNPEGNKVANIKNKLFFLNDDHKISKKPSDYKNKISKTISGYKNQIPANSDIIIAVLDASSKGRLSLTYYDEYKAIDFISIIEKWYNTCIWYNGNDGIQYPSIFQIIQYAFGHLGLDENTKKFQNKQHTTVMVDYEKYKNQLQCIFKCIIEGARMPGGIVHTLTNNASNPQRYIDKDNNICGAYRGKAYEKLLFITCALIRKYHNDQLQREEWTLNLEPEKKDRSYQFGRLLAVMEKVETDTYEDEDFRESNAIRLQSAFCDRPLHYSRIIIEKKLPPYFAKPKKNISKKSYYIKMQAIIGQIMDELSNYPDNELNNKLADTYLLGYYLQRNEMYKKHEKNAEVKIEESGE